MRITLAVAVACLGIVGIATADPARASIKQHTEIPAQGLGPALTTLAKEFDFQVLYRTEVVGTLRTQGASGAMTAAEALEHVLSGTGLTYKYLDDKTVTIMPVGAVATSSTSEDAKKGNQSQGGDQKKSFWDRFRLAQVDQGKNLSSSSSSALSSQSSPLSTQIAQADTVPTGKAATPQKQDTIPEIIVTAQKREERLQDVPIPVTAISASQLIDSNQPTIWDYYSTVPGLNIQPRLNSTNSLSIRGISTGGFSSSTVGITIDDVQFGGQNIIPDIDPGDLARIEVLRGPQGTLYGASSMGGLLKYVTVDPSTDRVSGQVQGGIEGVYNGAQVGYNFRGAINVPLSDVFAVRASAFTRQDPGYVDNPALHIDGINEQHASGGLLSALYRPSETLSLKLSALYQHAKGDGSNDVFVLPGFGDLQQNYVAGIGGNDKTVQVYSAHLTAKLGGIELTSITGYNVGKTSSSFDLTYFLVPPPVPPLPYEVNSFVYLNDVKTDKFTQEVRLSGHIVQALEYLVGGFYTHETTSFDQTSPSTDPITGVVVSTSGGYYSSPTTYKEYAVFADLTYHFTDRLDVQIGGRQSHIDQTLDETINGVNEGAPCASCTIVYPHAESSAKAFTYLVTPRFKVSEDLMVYARLASGYRPGAPNIGTGGVVRPASTPDKTENYEVGVKGNFLDHRLSVDASMYYIDWKNIQISLIDPVTLFGYSANGSGAKSQGVELSVEARPLRGLKVAGWVSYDDAVLTEPFPSNSPAVGVPGDRLPNSSRWSGNVSAQQDFPLWSGVSGFVAGVVSYVGDRKGIFLSSPQRQDFPGYAKVDLRAGAQRDLWTATLYVTNVADKRGIISGGQGQYPYFGFQIITPRTIGLNVTRSF